MVFGSGVFVLVLVIEIVIDRLGNCFDSFVIRAENTGKVRWAIHD